MDGRQRLDQLTNSFADAPRRISLVRQTRNACGVTDGDGVRAREMAR
jgi:hypothetical protein